jgi:hypothetical protein
VSEINSDDRFISDIIQSQNCLIHHEGEDMWKLRFATQIVNLPYWMELSGEIHAVSTLSPRALKPVK